MFHKRSKNYIDSKRMTKRVLSVLGLAAATLLLVIAGVRADDVSGINEVTKKDVETALADSVRVEDISDINEVQENENIADTGKGSVRRAYYDVCLKGVESEYLAEEEKERMQYYLPIGGGDMYFIIKDMDGDGTEEMLIGGENIGGLPDISQYTYDMLCTKVYFIFRCEDGKVKVPVVDVNDYDGGSFVLDNGCFGTKYWSSIYGLPEASAFYGNEEIFALGTVLRIWDDYHCTDCLVTYQAVHCSDEEGWLADEYFVDDRLVSKEEWSASIEENIISHIVPEEEIYPLSEENLERVLADETISN